MSQKKYFTDDEKKLAKQEWRRRHYQKNKDSIKEKSRKYREKNKDNEDFKRKNKEAAKKSRNKKLEEYKQKSRDSAKKSYHSNPEKWKQDNKKFLNAHPNYKKDWLSSHSGYMNNYIKTRSAVDVNFRLSFILRSRLRVAIYSDQKSGSAVTDLGCTIPELKIYLESKFQEGMSWDNWGISGWHIDHIIPLSSFDLSNREEFLKACHYTNLQPLWAEENYKKGNKVVSINSYEGE